MLVVDDGGSRSSHPLVIVQFPYYYSPPLRMLGLRLSLHLTSKIGTSYYIIDMNKTSQRKRL